MACLVNWSLRWLPVVSTLFRMSQAMGCPRCSGALQESRGDGNNVAWACLACGGVWLDSRTASAVKSAFGTWGARISSAASHSASHPPDVASHRSLPCPVCRQAMRKTRIPGAGIEVDRCDAHGTFYDKDELATALSAAAPAPPPRRLYPVALGATAVAGATVAAVAMNNASGGGAYQSAVVDLVEVGAEVAMGAGDIAEIGGAVAEGGLSVLGFLGDLLCVL